MNNAEIIELTHRHMVDVYGCLPLAFARGHGAYLFDADGNRYLDFFCGLAVTSLGHGNPRVVRAIKDPRFQRLSHRADCATGRAAGESFRRRQSFPGQLGRRSQRGRDQARAAMGQRAFRDFDDPWIVPWTHARHRERMQPGDDRLTGVVHFSLRSAGTAPSQSRSR